METDRTLRESGSDLGRLPRRQIGLPRREEVVRESESGSDLEEGSGSGGLSDLGREDRRRQEEERAGHVGGRDRRGQHPMPDNSVCYRHQFVVVKGITLSILFGQETVMTPNYFGSSQLS